MVDAGAAFAGQAAGRGGRADGDVGEAIAVDVARAGDREAEPRGAGGGGRDRPGRRRWGRRGAAEVDVRAADVGHGAVPPIRARDHVGEAVAVDVARAGHGVAEAGAGLIGRIERRRRRGAEPGSESVEEVSPPLVGQVAVRRVRADDHVGEPVAVDVARAGDRPAEAGAGQVGGVRRPGGRRRQPGRASGEQIGAPLVDHVAAGRVRAHDDVAEAVAVDVARAGHGHAEEGSRGVGRVGRPRRTAGKAGRRAAEEVRAPLVGDRAIPEVGADERVAETVAVVVAGGGDGVAKLRVGLVGGVDRPRRRRRESGGGAEVEESAPLVGGGHAVPQVRADDHVGVAVAVRVARAGDGVAELRAGLVRRVERDRRRSEAGRGAEVDVGAPLVARAHHVVAPQRRADHDVGVAVTIRVARARHGQAELRVHFVGRLRQPGRGGG